MEHGKVFPKKQIIFAFVLSIVFLATLFYSFVHSQAFYKRINFIYFPIIESASVNIRTNDHLQYKIDELFNSEKEHLKIEIEYLLHNVQVQEKMLTKYLHKINLHTIDTHRSDVNEIEKKYLRLIKENQYEGALIHLEKNNYSRKTKKYKEAIQNAVEQAIIIRDKDVYECLLFAKYVIIFTALFCIILGLTWLQVFNAFKKNISQIESTESELENERMKSFQQSKLASIGELAGGIAHEINNPLTIIAGSVTKLKKLKEKNILDDDEFYKNIERVNSTIKRITRIITSLRKLSRDSSEDERVSTATDFLINETMEFIGEKLKKNNISFSIDNLLLDKYAHCRSIEIQQVLINLITNSMQEIISQEQPWIKIELTEDEHYQYFNIIDSGNGIDEEVAINMMNPFFTTKEIGKGTGLGLSLSKRIAENHEGDLYVDHDCPNTKLVLKIKKISLNKKVA